MIKGKYKYGDTVSLVNPENPYFQFLYGKHGYVSDVDFRIETFDTKAYTYNVTFITGVLEVPSFKLWLTEEEIENDNPR